MNTEQTKRKQRVTIKDVAKAANVSIATVSYVLNNTPGQSISEDTRKKVLQFANLLGYECNIMAKYLATGKSNTVAAVVKDITPLSAPYYFNLLAELSRLLNRRNIALLIVDYADGFRNNTACDAYITVALSENEFKDFADTKYIPVIAIDSEFQDYLFYRINDNHAAICESTKRELSADAVSLITFELPNECIKVAERIYSDVKVVRDLKDLASLDKNANYVTVSKLIYENAVDFAHIKLESASFALKASAAADALVKAINRIQAPSDEHDIRV